MDVRNAFVEVAGAQAELTGGKLTVAGRASVSAVDFLLSATVINRPAAASILHAPDTGR